MAVTTALQPTGDVALGVVAATAPFGIKEHMLLVPETLRTFVRCKIMRPLLRLLRGGISPKRLAWSLAVGIVIGINPLIGVTTVVVILLAWVFRLNHVASQVGTHVVAPLQWLLFLPFIQAGVYLFRTRRLPLDRQQLKHLSHHPVQMVRSIWVWEWHALIIWAVIAVVLCPFLAIHLRRALVYGMRRHRTLLEEPQTKGISPKPGA